MNFSKIINLFKKGKSITIINCRDGSQWLSNGCAAYKIGGYPIFTEETIKTVLPDAAKWYINTYDDDAGFYSDLLENDIGIIETCGAMIGFDEETYLLMLGADSKTIAVNSKYFAPLKISNNIFFCRRNDCCVVKDGLLALAVIGITKNDYAYGMAQEVQRYLRFIEMPEEDEAAEA